METFLGGLPGRYRPAEGPCKAQGALFTLESSTGPVSYTHLDVYKRQMMNIPVLGIVENMSYFECPDCHSRHAIFGDSHVDQVAADHGIETVARMPISPKLAAAADKGLLELFDGDWLDGLADIVFGEKAE